MMQLDLGRAHRVWIGMGLPAVVALLSFGPWLLVRGDVPDPLATHFRLAGRANGSTPIWGFVLLQLAFALPCIAVLVRSGWRRRSVPPVLVVTATFVGILTGWIWCSILLANDGQASWHLARLGGGAVLGAYGSALGFSLPVALLVRRGGGGAPAGSGASPALVLEPDARVAWFGHARSAAFLVGGTAGTVAGALLVVLSVAGRVGSAAALSFALVVVGAAFLAFAAVDVRVDADGLLVRSGALHWPRVRIPLDRIESTSAIALQPTAWGGWGYRGSLRMLGRAAWVLRAGEGLEVVQRDGARFAVSVDRAEEAAALLNGLLARATPPRR
jgi:hypothetical protein